MGVCEVALVLCVGLAVRSCVRVLGCMYVCWCVCVFVCVRAGLLVNAFAGACVCV